MDGFLSPRKDRDSDPTYPVARNVSGIKINIYS